MNYQAVRAAIEGPLLTAYNSLSPAIPVYFDNVMNDSEYNTDEFVQVNIQFGLTTEDSLSTDFDRIRGLVVIRVYTEKNKGAARNQTLMDTAFTVLRTLNTTPKPATGTYVRLNDVNGPTFTPMLTGDAPDQQSRRAFTPFFISRVSAGFQAQVIV